MEKSLLFSANNLYGHINGGAELLLEFGFDSLRVQHLRKGEREFTIEQYRMTSPEAALGIYLSSAGKETRLKGIEARHTGSAFQITALKGRTLLHLLNPKGGEEAMVEMVAWANTVLEGIPEEQPRDLFERLPPEGRVQGSEFLVRGPLGLQTVFTLGDGDLLGLEGRLFASGAEYRGARGGNFSRLVIDYLDETTAMESLRRVREGLDRSLKMRRVERNAFTFQGPQGQFGHVERKLNRLTLTFRLNQEPEPSFHPETPGNSARPPER